MDEESFSFEFGGELPEELKALLQGITRKAMDSGLAHDHAADEVMPSKEQLGLVPGDYVAITHSEQPSDSEFMIAEVINPELHAEEFPDWEDRLLASYLFVKWYSRGNLEGLLGWVPRAKLVLCSESQFQTMTSWIKGEETLGDNPPDWLVVLYNNALAGLADANPEGMPYPVKCPDCGGFGVLVKLTKTATEHYAMGTGHEVRDEEWKKENHWHVVTPYHKDYKTVADLLCKECGYETRLPDELEMFG